MKKLIVLFLGVSVSVCFSQNTYELRKDQLRTLKKGLDYIQKYADSLNNFKCSNCKVLPDFFYNYNFDTENGYRVSSGLHSQVSIRKLIIDKIDNVSLLNAITTSKDRRLKKKNKIPKRRTYTYVITPYQEYSTYELVGFRLQELMNERNIGERASNYPD